MSRKNIIEARNITKRFVNITALNSVDFSVEKGEVHGLIGENGAGKSTLINILCGVIQPDEGEIKFNGKQIKVIDPHLATQLGVAVVHQNVCLVPLLTVAENVFLGSIPRRRFLGLVNYVDWKKLYRKSKEALNRIGFSSIDIKAKVNELTTGMKQAIQIARAISQNSGIKVLILDEPSAILTPTEVEKLFTILKKMKERGIAIIYISHYLDEVLKIADRITVLKDGRRIATMRSAEVTKDKLITMMTGKRLDETRSHTRVVTEEEVLSVKSLKGKGFEDVSFSLNKGEILGIAGLVGSGRIGVTRTIFGLYPTITGKIYLNKEPIKINTPKDAIRLGIGLLPEDRQTQGLVLNMTIRENVTITSCEQISHFGVIRAKREKAIVRGIVDKLKIRTPHVDEIVRNLSGGNQQKVSFAKWLFSNTTILMLEEPTRGVDVGAKVEIYRLMQEFIEQGGSIILVSSEIPEILRMSDEILVINKGKITGRLSRSEATEERIMKCML